MGIFKKYGPILLLLLGTILLILLSIPELITSPNDFLLVSEGDGLKSYYVFDYQLKYRTSFNHFSGLNYPYGENYLYTDGFPVLQFILQLFPFLFEYSIAIIHLSIVLGFLLTTYFLFKIIQFYTKNDWISTVGALSLFALQPQFYRLFGHLSMSYSCFIPMTWYFLIQFTNEKAKWKWTLLLFCTSTLWFFTHGYLGLMLTIFISGALLLQQKIWKNVLNLIQIITFTLVPLALFFILSKWSDSITDRTTDPYGFFEYQSHWKSVFLSSQGFFGQWISKNISFENLSWEGTAYIGMTSVIILFALLILRILNFFRSKPINLYPKELQFFLFSSMLLLLYSFGFPFNQIPFLLDILEPLKQFRAVGRFTWPFYFVCGVMSFCVLHALYLRAETKWKKMGAIGLLLVGSALFFVDSIPVLTQERSYSKNLFKIENLPIEQRQLISFIQSTKIKYQCILPLPWFHVGSELYGKEPNTLTMSKVLIASAHTGLPIYSSMLGRTSFSQTFDFFRSLGSKYQKKSKSSRIANKDFLIWFDYQPLFAEDEQELFDLSLPVFKNKCGELRSLSVKKIFEKVKVNNTSSVIAENHKQQDFLYENYSTKNNRLLGKVCNFNTFAKFDKNQLKPNHYYEVSFDYFWKGKKNMDNVLRIEFVKDKQVIWFYGRTICSYTDQQKDRVRVRAVFKTLPESYAYNFFLFGGDKKLQDYEIDNVLIRPIELNATWKNEKGINFMNSFPIR